MNFDDLPAEILTFRVKRTEYAASEMLEEQPVLSVEPSRHHPNTFEIRLKDFVFSAKPTIENDIRRLNAELASGRAILAQLANPAADESIELQIAFFTGECLEMGDVEIGVDEYVEKRVAQIGNRKVPIKGDKLHDKLTQQCCFQQGETFFFFMTAGAAIDNDLKPERLSEAETGEPQPTQVEEASQDHYDTELSGEQSADTEKPIPNRKNSFCVTGDGIRFVATEKSIPDGREIYTVTRLTKPKDKTARALRLAKGKLSFVDYTKAGQIQRLTQAQLSAITQDDGSYLKKWDEFGDLEGELLLKQARQVGTLEYCDLAHNRADDDGKATVSVRISMASDSALKTLEAGGVPEVEVVPERPNYLENEGLSFREFVGLIENEENENKFQARHAGEQSSKAYFNVSGFDPASRILTLEAEDLPAKAGMLVLSLAGEIAQIKRRIFARRSILQGRAVNPQLGLLIEEKGQIRPTRQPPKTRPLTAFVRAKVFPKNPPTVMQEKAIRVALNTPDIALIQGPPGTGKTTVIAAILERLNELADKRGTSLKGQVLLTGFQHDAVENMVARLSLNGIPFVPKFGRRSGRTEDDFSLFERKLEDWCHQIAREIEQRNPGIAEIKRETDIRNLCLQYLKVPTQALAVDLTDRITSLDTSILGEKCARRAANLAEQLSTQQKLNHDADHLLASVRSLRIRTASFADDGPERATDVLDDLQDLLSGGERDLLDQASLWRTKDGAPPFLKDLADLKKELLIRLSIPPVFRVEKQNDEVIALAEEAMRLIRFHGFSATDRKSAALAEFLAELEGNLQGMMDAVADYSYAFAATCQQSVNKTMQRQKGIIGRDVTENQKQMEYEYVIVDEAARVSPRDLMVPMAQGKRIILVGDHRQLPHIIDDEVARQMESGEATEDESEWLKRSMFEYLFSERLKALEDTDKITRRVTLDKQYRMHPMLGDFISRNFYEHFDSTEKFDSGLLASNFIHNLPDTENAPAIWLDVPATRGRHAREGTSWIREAEANAIVRQLKEWINSDAGKDLSYGVISFYKSQAERIKKRLGNVTSNKQQLHIGTVDSFQGMEFDVVFLSVVRTMPDDGFIKSIKSKAKKNGDLWTKEKEASISFGHLCLYNRLNVSMSRQKKLLVVVGDSTLVKNDLAAEFIPGLVDFHHLCKTEGSVLQCR